MPTLANRPPRTWVGVSHARPYRAFVARIEQRVLFDRAAKPSVHVPHLLDGIHGGQPAASQCRVQIAPLEALIGIRGEEGSAEAVAPGSSMASRLTVLKPVSVKVTV
jgi:hypothetical protein